MPENVSRPGLNFSPATVPSWSDFCQERDNKGYLWWVVNQLKSNPNGDGDPVAEVRKIYDDIRDLERNVGRKNDGEQCETLWDCVRHERQSLGTASARLDALGQRLNAIPDAMRETVREAVRAELKPLLESAITNLDGLLKDNSELKSKADSLSNEVERCCARVEGAEKQFQKVPDKIAELQRFLDSAKASLDFSRDENNGLRKELDTLRGVNDVLRANLDSLRAELEVCQKYIDELRKPPKRNWFGRMFSRSGEIFRKLFYRSN